MHLKSSTGQESAPRVPGTGAAGFRHLLIDRAGWIVPLLYLLGFLPPWNLQFPLHPSAVLWLSAAKWLERAGSMHLATATLAVTSFAVIDCFVGALLRILGGRYARLVGSLIFATGVSVLMSPGGALLFLILMYLLHVLRIARFASQARSFGVGQVPATGRARVHWIPWLEVILRESFYLAFALCFALLAWRYDSGILIRCLIICFGASLIIRALLPGPRPEPPAQSGAGVLSRDA